MKATEANLLSFLQSSPQFVIPVYQRTYSWTERECQQLWDDIMRTGSDNQISAHFVGSIVYIEEGLYHVTTRPPLLVIDGQQRLTTVMLILEALARHLRDGEPVDGFSAQKLRNYYLLNPLEKDERGYKLLLTQTDKASLMALMRQNAPPSAGVAPSRGEFRVLREADHGSGRRCRPTLPGTREADGRRHRTQSRAGQSSAHLREHEFDGTGAEPGRPHSQLRPDGPRAECAGTAVRRQLAPDGSCLWTRGVRDPL